MTPELYSNPLGVFPVGVVEGSIFVNPKTKAKYRLVKGEWVLIEEGRNG